MRAEMISGIPLIFENINGLVISLSAAIFMKSLTVSKMRGYLRALPVVISISRDRLKAGPS
jgi:hypothetical protein